MREIPSQSAGPVAIRTVDISVKNGTVPLVIEEYACPNPAYRHGVFKLGGEIVGSAVKSGDAGWTLRSNTKKMRPERELVIAMLRATVRKERKERDRAMVAEQRAQFLLGMF